jgi:hypothetical protein
MAELADLLADKITTLSIRYLASDRATVDLPDPAFLLSPTMDRFHAIDIHLPALTAPSRIVLHRSYQGQSDPHTSFSQQLVHLISLDPDRRKRYAVWLEGNPLPPMGGLGPVAIKPEERVILERYKDVVYEGLADELVAVQAGLSDKKGETPGGGTGKKGKARDDGPVDGGSDHWERETNLKLFGGLLSLRLESKKH